MIYKVNIYLKLSNISVISCSISSKVTVLYSEGISKTLSFTFSNVTFFAKKVTFEKVKDKVFEIPSEYKTVTFDEMEQEMTEIFDSFK